MTLDLYQLILLIVEPVISTPIGFFLQHIKTIAK